MRVKATRRDAIGDNPLFIPALLEAVLAYAGASEGAYITTVNRSWAACHVRLMALAGGDSTCSQHINHARCTAWRAVFASPARVRFAYDCGLDLDGEHDYDLQRCAGRHASVDTLLVAHELGLPINAHVMHGVAESQDDLPKLACLRLRHHHQFPYGIADTAAAAGNIKILRWLKQRGCGLTSSTSYAAAARPNNIPVLQLLLDSGCYWDIRVCSAACTAGDLEQLQWLHERGAELDPATAVQAAAAGRADVLQWMQKQGAPLREEIFDAAAKHGQLQVCKWLHSAQCPWDAKECEHAAESGHIDVLRFLMTNGCPYKVSELCATAVLAGAEDSSTELLQLLDEQGLLSSTAQLTRLLRTAGANSNLVAALWLRHNGAAWPAVLRSVNGKAWPGESLAWARAEGCTSPAV
jgi:hypothetical protein